MITMYRAQNGTPFYYGIGWRYLWYWQQRCFLPFLTSDIALFIVVPPRITLKEHEIQLIGDYF